MKRGSFTFLFEAARVISPGGVPLLLLLSLLCPLPSMAQEASAPLAPQAQPSPAKPARPVAVPVLTQSKTPRPPKSVAPHAPAFSVPVTPQSRPSQPAPAAPPQRPLAPLPPRQIVTVVHRLTGWKLLAWLASNGPPALELDEMPSASDAHTNIVAGYVYDDGRTIIVRLPQTEAEIEMFPTATQSMPELFPALGAGERREAEFTLVTSGGKRVGAKFVGLDSLSGLSLLEATAPVFSGAAIAVQGDTEDPTVGQRVRLYAPTPAAKPSSGDGEGYIYLSIDRRDGRLTEVLRGPSGKLMRVTARADVTPEWTGAVAANESGEVVGIVSHSASGESQIVPVATMLGARERVLKLRGSAPQPWLGIRGDASFQLKLDQWVNMGWKPELAMPRIRSGQGVFLTAVAPGTPAALAGLRPGDVIASVGARDVRSIEDLSFTLNEAGVGSIVDFTIWRALEPSPLKLSVTLKGVRNPAIATAAAEELAARESMTAPQPGRTRPAQVSLQSLGLHTIGLTPRNAARLGAKSGLLVVAVRPETRAAACGLRSGDVIEKINGAASSSRELNRLLTTSEDHSISLGVVRERRRVDFFIPLFSGVERGACVSSRQLQAGEPIVR